MSLVDFSYSLQEKSQAFVRVLEYCHELLLNFSSDEAELCRQYLISRYGSLAPFETTFGYFPSQLDLNLLIKKFGVELLIELGLIYPIYSTNLFQGILSNHNLIFPYLDEYGNIVAFIGRQPYDSILPEFSKYKTTKFNKSLFVYGLFQAKESIWKNNKVVLVEGQLDCLALRKSKVEHVVALGSTTLTIYHLFSLLKYTNNFYLLLDLDKAGNVGSKKILDQYSQFANWNKILLPEGYKDIDIYLKDNFYSFDSYERLQTQSL